MKIILSRKGFDSAYGKVPSPIFPDGKLCTLPIPEDGTGIRYSSVSWNGTKLGNVVEELTKGRIHRNHEAHLDPDLNPLALPRKPGWRGLFGQAGAAQSHLANQGVAAGDLFLYFGWFRRVETISGTLAYVRDAPHLHVLFGWLQIGSVEKVDESPKEMRQWARYHPHFRQVLSDMNTLYVAAEQLKLPGLTLRLPGAGMFPVLKPVLCLTAPSASRGTWRLPRWFCPGGSKKALSYHSDPDRWLLKSNCVHLSTVARGQEFVLDCDHYLQSLGWLANLFTTAMR